nr:6,7-dimethyl-8-ribityllumazine synthase [uncultured Nevskia sp.]
MSKAVKKAVQKATVKLPLPAPHKSGYAAPPKPEKGEFKGKRIAVVATRWNVEVVEALTVGVHKCLKDWGVSPRSVQSLMVPGAFELPLAASALMDSGKFDGVVALGAVIRGDTPHFEFVAGECSRGLREAAQIYGVALGFGVLTVNTAEQAYERCKPGKENKGYEAAAAMLEMIRLLDSIDV